MNIIIHSRTRGTEALSDKLKCLINESKTNQYKVLHYNVTCIAVMMRPL